MKAIVFPGQGAQYVGMGKDLYDNFREAKETFSLIDKILGFKISDICFSGPENQLKNTALQQSAILAVSIAAYQVFRKRKVLTDVDYLAGLSLGEYTCLYAAEVLDLEEVVKLVRERGLAMERASKEQPSCMLAVLGLNKETLEDRESLGFYIANINAPQQVVISLHKSKKEEVKKYLENLGGKVIELQVSGGFHSPFMDSAKAHLEKVIESLHFRKAKVPVVSNFTAKPHFQPQEIKNNLINQLVSPVLWKECVEFMVNKGVDTFIEIGPSKVLKGLIRKINPQVKVVNIEKSQDLSKGE